MSYPNEALNTLYALTPEWRNREATALSFVDYYETTFDDITVEIIPTGRALFIIEGDRRKIRELLENNFNHMDSQARKTTT